MRLETRILLKYPDPWTCLELYFKQVQLINQLQMKSLCQPGIKIQLKIYKKINKLIMTNFDHQLKSEVAGAGMGIWVS